MNRRFYWTALICGLLAFAAPLAYASDQGDGGDGGGDHSGMSGDHNGSDAGGMSGDHNGGSDKMDKTEHADMQNKQSVADKLERNTELADSLKADLPTDSVLTEDAAGFKNLGEFVAAVRVSKNLGISFTALKQKMLEGDSLGEAIHALKPEVDSTKIADDATQQAQSDTAGQ